MGGCLSFWHKPDLTGSTFSHYSLNSQSEHLDLYPGFRYVETDGSISEDDENIWRRSSAPLLNSWETIPGPHDTLSVSSTVSHSSRARSGETNKTSPVTQHSPYFGWDIGIVKLRRSLKMDTNIAVKPVEFRRDSSDTEGDTGGSVRDSGETIVEDLM